MSPETLKREQAQARRASPPQRNGVAIREDELIIDTSAMSDDKRAAMEVAELARDHADDRKGFAAGLFLGTYDLEALASFPTQSEEDRLIGDEMVRQVSEFLSQHLDADQADEARTIPAYVVEGLMELGVFRMKVPNAYGGLGYSQVNYNRVLMAIASYCGSTAVLVSAHQSIGVPQPLKMFGTDQQKDKYLTRIANGELSAFALTEPEVGSDPAKMTTTAVLSEDGSHYILNGIKQWTTNGPIADLFVVMAQTAPKIRRGRERKQITAFIVEADSPGVETLHRCDFMGLRAIQNGVIQFKDVKVPAENLIWGEGLGLKLALNTLNTGRLTLPAACTGMGKQCLSIARQWARERVQWGAPIGRHEVGSQKIADIACTTFAMEAVTWLTSHWAEANRDIRIEAAMAKLFCSESAWRLVDLTMALRGGRGYERADSLRARGEEPFPVERMMRDCRINTIIEGTSDIMRLFLAREALDPHLRLGADLMRPGIAMGRKLRTALRMLAFYGRWYPVQVAGSRVSWRFGARDLLARHDRWIARASHRLAGGLFRAMVRHQARLERRQILLAHLMEIGTELFAMAATCSYARSMGDHPHAAEAMQLADAFCRQARRRIAQHFRSMRFSGDHRVARSLARDVLEDRYLWLEEGIIPAVPAT